MKIAMRSLDELGSVRRGKSKHRPRDSAHLYDGPYPFIQTSDVKNAGLYITEYTQSYSAAGLAQSKLWKAGTLCITIAANIGDTAILSFEACFPDSIIGFIADPQKSDARYIKYLFDAVLQKSFKSFTQGSAQDNLSQEKLLSLKLPVAEDVQDQTLIADNLSAYDNLIDINRRRIQLLEESARLLYREWFVYFRFPGHEKVKIVDGIPNGWERKPISMLTSFLGRGVAPHYDEYAGGLVINQKCIRGGRLDVSLSRRQSREFKQDRQIQPGDVLINSTGEGTLGRVAQVITPIANCTADTHVTIARPITEIGVHYFGQSLIAWEPRLSTMGRGSTNQTELSRGQIGEIDILVPSHLLVQQFEEYSGPIFLQVSTLLEQNQKLKIARDLLLPRLMSGAIEV
ncbi:MAG: restriction endonuclease subunit S [Syntrophales bacterium]